MKKNLSIVFVILVISISMIFSSCYKNSMLDYYSDDSNYETLEVRVVTLNDTYMEVEFLSNVHEHYTYEPFHLINLPDLQTQLNSGDIINIITAPEYFYDGYHIPVVGVSKGDKVYLNFENGKQNLLNYIKQYE